MAVGKQLKEKRKELNLSIEEVEKETKIRKKYLRALEEDNYEEIPGLVYAKAFLKTYSSFLGLNQEEIIEEFERWRHLEDVDAELEGSKSKVSRRRRRKNKNNGFLSSFLSFSPRTLLILFILVLVAGGVGYNFVIMNGSSPENEIENEENVIVEEDTEEEEEERDEDTEDLALEELDMYDDFTDQTEESEYEMEIENGVTEDEQEETIQEDTQEDPDEEEEVEPEIPENLFILNTIETSWVRIIVDGENVFEGTLDPGEEQEYQPDETLNIRTGNAGGVEIEIGGEFIGTLGESGEIVETEYEF